MNIGVNRLCVAIIIVLAGMAHAAATYYVPNTPFGMGAFHGCAALIDILILTAVSCVLQGSVRRHSQYLLYASIAGNIVGWFLYMAYVSPAYYNMVMWTLTALQIARLLYSGKGGSMGSLVAKGAIA
jgi:hypothetical protein